MHKPPRNTRRCVQASLCDARRYAHALPVTQGVAHTPLAPRTQRVAHMPRPVTQGVAHAPPPPWHKALRTHPTPPPWRKALRTRPLRDLSPWPTGEKCVALTTKPRPSAHRHHASCTSPPVTQGVAFRLPFVTQGATHTPSRWHKALRTPLLRHAHNALRTCPPHDTMRCAHGAKKATRAQPPPHTPEC